MHKKYYVLLGLFIVAATALRFHKIGTYGLLGDELYALSVANFVAQEGAEQNDVFRKDSSPYFTNIEIHNSKRDFSNFLTAVSRRDNGSAALHTFVLHYWIKVFGMSDASLRGLSALSNIILIVVLYFFVLEIFKRQDLALLSVFLASISPFYIAFSQVARTYSLLFLIALVASWLFLKILKLQKFSTLHVLYGIIGFALLMCHYSTFALLLFHGLYTLVYHRKWKVILYLAVAATIPIAGLLLWLNTPGGSFAFHAIEHSRITYLKEIALYNDPFLQSATFGNILTQVAKVTALSFLPLEVVYNNLSGYKNLAFSILHSCLIFGVMISSQKDLVKLISILISSLVLSFLVSVSGLSYVYFSIVMALLFYSAWSYKHKIKLAQWSFLLVFGFSIFMLIVFAVMDGNTFRLIPRYSGYGYVFGVILWAGIVIKLWTSHNLTARVLLAYQSIVFVFYCVVGINAIYIDDQPRYFHLLHEPRIANPYLSIAQKIEDQYVAGDTVIYPSLTFKTGDMGYDMPPYSVQDAQYINLYLRDGQPEIIQRVDTTEREKVFIKHLNGEKSLIFDFENGRYRY